jgi:2-dehydropantoate 2-reductase
MKILVYGAGVIGSIYAAKFFEAGYDVTLLARDKNFEMANQNGITLRELRTGEQKRSKIPLTSFLAANDFYDLIIVTVQLGQLNSVIPALKNNNSSPLIMFMLNNPESVDSLLRELNPKHIILGFPDVAGSFNLNVIDYVQIRQQKTWIGEIDGRPTDQIRQIRTVFEKCGFKVAISPDMVAWLKTHAIFISCVAASIVKENGSSAQLGKSRSSTALMVNSICEGFKALQTLGIRIAPTNLKIIFLWMPRWFSILYWQKAMLGEVGMIEIAPHANRAKDEMKLVAEKILTIVHSSNFPTPRLDALLSTFIAAN